jgi:hypothetical protein
VEAIESSPGAIPGADEEMAATTYQKGVFFRHNGDLTMENGDLTSKDCDFTMKNCFTGKTGDFAKTHWWGPSVLAKKLFTTWLTLGFLAV